MDEFENLDVQTVEQQPQQPQEQPQERPQEPVQPAAEPEQPAVQGPYGRVELPQKTYAHTNYAQSPYAQTLYGEPQSAVKPAKKQKKTSRMPGWLIPVAAGLIVLSCAISAFCVSIYWQNQVDALEADFASRVKSMQEQLGAALSTDDTDAEQQTVGSMTPGQVYATNVNAVVAVSSYVSEAGFYGYSEYESFGSGFIFSEDGYVVTNYHVVENASTIRVTLHDNNVYTAELKGYDATNDIALLKIEAEDLPCVKIGSSDELAVGDRVAAIGNPLGELTSTLTVGYVSAKDRVITTDGTAINMLQTDAAINSGNSGGPLFNMKGEVVGITTAKYSGTSSSGATIEGIGFAIPIDDVIGMLEDLREKGYVTGAYLGVMVHDVSETSVADGLPEGVYVEEAVEGYGAKEAGVERGDIITALGEYEVDNMTTLTRVLRKFEAGQQTQITVYRNGSYLTLDITLSEKPQQSTEEAEEEPTYLMPGDEGFEEWYKDFIERHYGED